MLKLSQHEATQNNRKDWFHMVKIIMGLKGSGKTKRLVDLVLEAVNSATGDVVVIEKDKKLTYDIPYSARLIDAGEYNISSYEVLRGFLCGLHSGNYDITHIFIDNFFKLVNNTNSEDLSAFMLWLDNFAAKEGIEFVISVSADVESCPEAIKKYII